MEANISVVMATYNGEKYIKQQLESIAEQRLPPYEIIISDDNSTDQTCRIVDEFQKKWAVVPIRRNKNVPGLGFRDNFLLASSLASGEWIAFCDQDDVWRNDKLEKCALFTGNEHVTQIGHQANLIDSNGSFIAKFDQGIKRTGIKSQFGYDPWGTFLGFSMVVRRSVLGSVSDAFRFVDYIDPKFRIAHDRWAFFLAQTLGCTAEIAEPLTDYRQHESNAFGAGTGRSREKRSSVAKRHRHYVDATKEMLKIVESLPELTERKFPSFDRARAVAVLRHAVLQQETRDVVYNRSRFMSLITCLNAFAAGVYRNPHRQSVRWKSFAKDVLYSFSI